MPSKPSLQKGNGNFDVDYVIVFRYATTEKSTADAQFEKLLRALHGAGLELEVRPGENHSLLVFVKASEKYLSGVVYRSRVKDWLYGIRQSAPEKETKDSLDSAPLKEAERLRIVHHIITSPPSEGGAGITAKAKEWENVESIFPLHDHQFNKEWLRNWGSTWMLSIEELTATKDRFGEKIGFYFAFLQSYFAFLLFPAAFGASAYFVLPNFSPVFAIVNCLWSVFFVEYWKRQETDLAILWGTRGVSQIQRIRPEFKHEKEVQDPVTGETMKIFPQYKRVARQALQIPFALISSVALAALIATCFGIEVFISEVYKGPFQSVLVFLPTGLLTVLVPTLTTILGGFATRLNNYENYETEAAYEAAMTQKTFVFNFITSYVGIFLTAFVYVPFGTLIVPYLDIFSLTVRPFSDDPKHIDVPKSGFQINQGRLRKQVIYFVVTAQIVNLALEVIVPYLKRQVFRQVKNVQSELAARRGGEKPEASFNDAPEEEEFLTRVRSEALLDVYNVNDDLREMCMQFGYLTLFSVVWPLAAVSFLVNNWVELRSDAIKICVEMQRPTPQRADSIGPWLDSLGFLTWLGSLTTAALVYLFADGGPEGLPYNIRAWGILLCIMLSEHLYFGVGLAVKYGISKIESTGLQQERRERFLVRKRYLEESLGADAANTASGTAQNVEKVGGFDGLDRTSLEDEARESGGAGAEVKFWRRQRGPEDVLKVGQAIILRDAPEDKKNQ